MVFRRGKMKSNSRLTFAETKQLCAQAKVKAEKARADMLTKIRDEARVFGKNVVDWLLDDGALKQCLETPEQLVFEAGRFRAKLFCEACYSRVLIKIPWDNECIVAHTIMQQLRDLGEFPDSCFSLNTHDARSLICIKLHS